MEVITSLRQLLVAAVGETGVENEQELFDELTINKTRLLSVYDFGPRNPNELKEIQQAQSSGHANGDFASEVVFVSQHLNCSEKHCASLLQSVHSSNPNIGRIQAVEYAVLAHHQLRRYLADCLRFIFEAVRVGQRGVGTPFYSRLAEYAKRQLVGSGGEGSLANRLFKQIDQLGQAIVETKTAVTNAVSNTNVPTQGGPSNLGHAVLSARLESLVYERRTLAFAFYYVSRAGFLTSHEIKLVLEWLDKHPKSDMSLYIFSALLAAFDLSYSAPGSESAEQKTAFAKEQTTLSFIKRKLSPGTDWIDPSLKATVLLKWTLLLTEARYRDPSLEHREGFRNEDLEMLVFNAVQGDAFTYLLRIVSQLSTQKNTGSQLLNELTSATPNDANEPKQLVSDEFKQILLHEIELLLRSLLTQAPAELRKIKHKQEDHFRPRTDRRASFRPGDTISDRQERPRRNDIAILFQLLGLLYLSLPPDRAIQFWGAYLPSDLPRAPYEAIENDRGKLPSFLRWAVEVREPDLTVGVFDMLAGLATGVACAECAHNFLASGTLDAIHGVASLGTGIGGGRYEMASIFTWGGIFGQLESWAALGANNRGAHGVPPPQLLVAAKDVLLGLSFLKLLAVVVGHSMQARHAIFSHPQYRAIACLISLIPLGVPLELKGAIFETLSAFCQPGAGPMGVDICKTVWAQMERLEVLNVRGTGFSSKGVEVELEEVEVPFKVYPATLPFLELLATLIHTPKRVSIKRRVSDPEPIHTIPDNLGQPYRIPGVGPYVAFVVDNILARLPLREFLSPNDQWKMADLALCFLERCLASYDLESLPMYAGDYNTKGIEALFPLLHHPGFDVLVRILSDSQLRATLITYVVEGSEQLQGQYANNPRFANVLLRAIRIMDRVLEIQDMFLDHLVPVLMEFDSTAITGVNISTSFLSKIDQGLSLNQKSVPSIGSYVNHVAYPEITFLAIKVLSSLSQSPSFPNIAALIERSSESNVMLDGFVRLLSTESTHDVAAAEEWTDLWTGAGAPDTEEVELFAQGIRVAILDLLLRGTRRTKSSSLAFWLLFGKSSSDAQVQDPHALNARAFCLHIILHLLNTGIPRISGKGKERDRHRALRQRPLFEAQPVLAERLYKLLYQLCDHPRTSSPIMLYLRTREDFFVRHLSAIAIHCPIDERTPHIEMEYGDGSRVVTTCATLKAFLQLRSWLLDLVSLELHILTNKGQYQRVKDLLDLLLGTTDSYHESDGDWEHDIFRPFNDVSQSRIRIIEIFQSLEFAWYDSVTVNPIELQFYAQLNLQACLRTDENGSEVVDRNALFQLLSGARRQALRQGQITTPAQSTQLDLETKYILESCVAENNRREVQYSLNIAYASWKRILEVVLTKCFSRIAHDQRENILFDLIHVLPPSIQAAPIPESSAVLLSEGLLLLITKLREERRQLQSLSPSEAVNVSTLPTERMLGLLHHIVDCILDRQRQEVVRGNLYAALTNYLNLVSPQPGDACKTNSSRGLTSSDSSLLLSMANSLSLSSRNGRGTNVSASLEASSYAVLKQVMDRLVATIAKDAVDGAEVWKTVAFTLLESLARLSRLDTKHLVINALDRYGLLLNFVHGLRESDESLQSVLRPDPDDLNPLYVYETKMSFLTRLAESRHGAERLLESRILPILAQVDFLDARPEMDESYAERDSFLPSALSRYHQLLVPALQLVGVIVATLGPKHATAAKQASDFLQNHRDTLVIILKQDMSDVTLATLEELDLIVSLCSLVLPSISKAEFLNVNSGFGSLHNAILALASRHLGGLSWARYVRPADESEQIESETRAAGYAVNRSKFEVRVHGAAQKLRKSLLGYLSTANGLGESEMTLVLSPVTSNRQIERTSMSVPLPTLNDAIDALNGFTEDILNTLQEIVDIGAELEHKEHVRTDNLEELTSTVDVEAIRRLDMGQRRALVVHVLEQTQSKRKLYAESTLYMIEVILLLIWRHISYYTDPENSSTAQSNLAVSKPPLSESKYRQTPHMRASAMRFLVVPDASTFQKDAAVALSRVLEKIDGIELNEDFVYGDWRSTRSYFDIMCRRLRETLAIESSQTNGRRIQA